jgi:periodic tryptophan protein 2
MLFVCCFWQEFLDRRKMTEWGSLALVDEGQGDDGGKSISLPGVKAGDMSSRHWKPEVRVSCIHFSPTGKTPDRAVSSSSAFSPEA